jgi:hypothetical protein
VGGRGRSIARAIVITGCDLTGDDLDIFLYSSVNPTVEGNKVGVSVLVNRAHSHRYIGQAEPLHRKGAWAVRSFYGGLGNFLVARGNQAVRIVI